MNLLLALTRDTLLFLGAVVVSVAIITRGLDGAFAIGVIALLVLVFGGVFRRVWALVAGLLNYAR